MKSPEYVQAVTAAYRAVLDRTLAAKDEGARASVHATAEERRSLEEAFSRGFTTAYLEGARGNDVMSYQRPNNRGAFVGRVADVRKGEALIAHERRLVEGDVLEFWTGKGHVAQTLGAPERDGSGHTRVPLDARAARSVRAGDRVFRVRSAEAAYVDDALAPRIPVEGTVAVRLGEPVRVTFAPAAPASVKGVEARIAARLEERLAGVRVEGAAEGCVVEAARTKAVDAADVRAHIDRLGSTPYRIVSLSVDVDEGVGIGFWRAPSGARTGPRKPDLPPARLRRGPRASARERPSATPARPPARLPHRRPGDEPGVRPRGQALGRRPRLRAGPQLPARRGRHRRPTFGNGRTGRLSQAVPHRAAGGGARPRASRPGSRRGLRSLALGRRRPAGVRGQPGRPAAGGRTRPSLRRGTARPGHEPAFARADGRLRRHARVAFAGTDLGADQRAGARGAGGAGAVRHRRAGSSWSPSTACS